MTIAAPQAIPTVFNGIPMRSRLEAKAAMFMTLLGIRYEYEPEGFSLWGGLDKPRVGYCPDFFLPDLDCYLEIKPNEQALGDTWTGEPGEFDYSSGYMKASGLARDSGKSVYVVCGFPWLRIYGFGQDCDGESLCYEDNSIAFGWHWETQRFRFSLPFRSPGWCPDKYDVDVVVVFDHPEMEAATALVLAHQWWTPRK